MRTWNVHEAFEDHVNSLDDLEHDIINWMENTGNDDYSYARKVTLDAVWELWDSSLDLEGWIQDVAWGLNTNVYLSYAGQLLGHDPFATIVFDNETKAIYVAKEVTHGN